MNIIWWRLFRWWLVLCFLYCECECLCVKPQKSPHSLYVYMHCEFFFYKLLHYFLLAAIIWDINILCVYYVVLSQYSYYNLIVERYKSNIVLKYIIYKVYIIQRKNYIFLRKYFKIIFFPNNPTMRCRTFGLVFASCSTSVLV